MGDKKRSRTTVMKSHLQRAGVSYVLSVAFLTGVAVALGLVVWGVVSGWAGVSGFYIVGEINKGIAQQRSLLIIEVVDLERQIVWVSNPGKTELVILSCVVYIKGSPPPARTYQELARVPASMTSVHPLDSSKCLFPQSGSYKTLVVEIQAIPSTLYNPANPLENIQWAILVRSYA